MATANLVLDSKGRFRPCCRFQADPDYPLPRFQGQSLLDAFSHPTFQKVRSQLQDGIFPLPCSECKKEEAAGLRSLKSKFFRYYPDLMRNKLQALEIFLGSACNMKCRMCGPESSSLWAKELGRSVVSPVNIEEILATAPMSELRYVRFLGGETLLNPNFFKALDLLYKGGATKIVISIASNGSVPPSPEILESLRRFKRVAIDFSIDGIGEVGQYIRHGVSWGKVESSLDEWLRCCVDDPRFYLTAHTTVQALNFASLLELIEFCMDRKFYFWGYKVLIAPDVFRVQRIPQAIRKQIADRWMQSSRLEEVQAFLDAKAKPGSWKHLTQSIPAMPESPLEPCLRSCEEYDRKWGTNWRSSLVGLESLLSFYQLP